MSRVWFVVPAAGRESLTTVCLRQLRRTCDALAEHDIDASAVVIANDRNLRTAVRLGFATVNRNNNFLAMKFNDGIALACDDRHNARPVDYVIPCGSDDFVDHNLFLNLPPADTVLAFRRAAFVSEDGAAITSRLIDYPAGVGIRVYPRAVMERLNYRPADEDRKRACDTSIYTNLHRAGELKIQYGDLHDYQIVDWKSPRDQLNSYKNIVGRHRKGSAAVDPFVALDGLYPDAALCEMRAHYGRAGRLVAA